MSEKVETRWWFNILKNGSEIATFITGIATFIGFILTKANLLSEHRFLCAVDLLNITILIVSVNLIKQRVFTKEDGEYKKMLPLLEKNGDDGSKKIMRVNALIGQLIFCVKWFAIILAAFYACNFIIDYLQFDYDKIKIDFNANTNIFQLIKNNAAESQTPAQFLFMEVIINAANLFSAAFLFVAFQVLFLKTVDDQDNKTWMLLKRGKAYIPFAIAFAITVFNIILFSVNVFGPNANLSVTTTMIRLTGGMYNGVAMLLLFSRFISMEYFLKESNYGFQRTFYLYGTLIILPLYVVIQPLYGLINAVEMKMSTELFKAIVFLVCFWGKLFFLLFVYTGLKKKWIHSYLFKSLVQDS
jgi:hypothetical protein